MKKCINCDKQVKNKYCDVSCQNKHQGVERINKRFGKLKEFSVNCFSCENSFIIKEREKLFPKKEKYFCSRACANKRTHSDFIKEKISKSLTKLIKINCKQCGVKFKPKRKTQQYCSISCSTKYNYKLNENIKKTQKNNIIEINCKQCGVKFKRKKKRQKFCSVSCGAKFNNVLKEFSKKGGLASANSQNRRSKNEIYFAELCEKKFKNVENNKPIFNGWDADVIIHDLKVAVLWNGKWHYEKITKNHSLKQVQNRDRIKLNEIKDYGYEPHIIKDMGKHDKEFVEKQFKVFKDIYCVEDKG